MKNNKGGFTLVELLVAVSIMGIITLIALPTVNMVIEKKNNGIYKKYGDTLISSAKLYADSYDVDLFGNHTSGCEVLTHDRLKEKNLIKEIQIKNSQCFTDETYVIVKKINGRYQYQQQLVCRDSRLNKSGTILYEDKISSPICTEESAAEGPKIIVDNPKEEWVTTEKAYVAIKIEDLDGLQQNSEVIYKWAKDPEGTNVVLEKKLNFGNDLDDKSTTKKIPRPTADGKYYLIVQPVSVVDVFGNYTSKKVVKGLYKFDSHNPNCNKAITFLSATESEKKWINKDVNLSFQFSEDELEIVEYKWITYKDGQEHKVTDNVVNKTSLPPKVTKTLSADGKRTYAIKVYDASGRNTLCKNDKEYWIDQEKPTCTISPNDEDKWHTKEVQLTLKPDDKVSGVDGKKITTDTTPKYDGKTNKATQTEDTKGQKWYGYVIDKAGNVGKCSTTVKVDKTKPTCEIKVSEGKIGNNGWYVTDVKLYLEPKDDTSGVSSKVDLTTSASASYGGTTTGEQKENAAAQYWYGYVKDKAGNVGDCKKGIKKDDEKPFCTSSGGKSSWTNADVTLTGTCEDNSLSGCAGNATYTYTTNTNTTTASPGKVYDNAGNSISCPADQTVKIDKDPPKCTSSGGKSSWTNNNITLTGTCTDTGGSKCKENITKTFNSNTETTTASPGTVYDKAGNSAPCPADQTVKIDKTAPTCESSGGSTSWTNNNITLTGTCRDTGGSKCKENTTKTFNSNTETTTASPGKVYDKAGNSVDCPANQTVKIDKDPPKCTSSGGSTSWTKNNITLKGDCTDKGGSKCVEDITKTYNTTTNTTTASPGTVYDKAGNSADCPANQTVKIDKTAPTLQMKAFVRNRETHANGNQAGTTTIANNNDNIKYLEPTRWFNVATGGVNFDIEASDEHSGINNATTWKYDDTGATAFSESRSLNTVKPRSLTNGKDSVFLNSDGYRHATYIVEDNVGNTSRVRIRVKIDRTIPTKPVITNPTNGKCTTSDFTIKATSNGLISTKSHWKYKFGKSGTEYKLDTSDDFKLKIKNNRVKKMYIRSVDDANNASDWATTKITKKNSCLVDGCNYYGDKVDAVSFNNCDCHAREHSEGWPHFCVEEGKICVKWNNGDLSKYPRCKDQVAAGFTYFCPKLDEEDIEDNYDAKYIFDYID